MLEERAAAAVTAEMPEMVAEMKTAIDIDGYLHGGYLNAVMATSQAQANLVFTTGTIVTNNEAWCAMSQANNTILSPQSAPAARVPFRELRELVPSLETHIIPCPVSDCGVTPLFNVIMHLNDFHRWSREQIADWLDTLDVDLTVTAASKGD